MVGQTFPTRKDTPERINAREFGDEVLSTIREKVREAKRDIDLQFDLEPDAELLIPPHILQAVMEGLIRNGIEATPDHGSVTVTGRIKGDRYLIVVKDTGVGIPEKERELIFQGFYPVQETDDYSSGRPYSFNAGGKGIDLLRIRMFSEVYAFRLVFTSKRCPKLEELSQETRGEASRCERCESSERCAEFGDQNSPSIFRWLTAGLLRIF